jgi:hypothetical protein
MARFSTVRRTRGSKLLTKNSMLSAGRTILLQRDGDSPLKKREAAFVCTSRRFARGTVARMDRDSPVRGSQSGLRLFRICYLRPFRTASDGAKLARFPRQRPSIKHLLFYGVWNDRADIGGGIDYVNKFRDKPRG